jgi:hypothetical protein
MKIIKTSFLLISLLTFNGCSDADLNENTPTTPEPENTSEVLFTLNISEDTSTSEDWIIVHNDRGELIDYSAYENGDIISIEAMPELVTDNIVVTNFTNSKNNGNEINNFVSYTEIPKGSTWNFKPYKNIENTNEMRGQSQGTFDVTITNIPFSTNIRVSDNFGVSGGSGSTTGNTSTVSIALFENTSEHMISVVENNGASKYIVLGSERDGTNVTLDYSQFNEFDSFIDVAMPMNLPYFSSVFAFEDNQEFSDGGGFHLNLTFPFSSTFPIGLGYLDRFNKYLTQFTINNENYFYSYKKYGEKPEFINVVENPSIVISNPSLNNFEFITSVDFKRKVSTWSTSEGTRNMDLLETIWSISSKSGDKPVIGDIPAEILTAFPNVNLDALQYRSSGFHLGFDTYEEYIEKKFISTELNNPFNSEEVITFFN